MAARFLTRATAAKTPRRRSLASLRLCASISRRLLRARFLIISRFSHPQEMSGGAVDGFGGFAQGFGERRMWMNDECEIASAGGHLDCQHGLPDQFPGAGADNAGSEHAVRFRIED